MLFNTNVLLLSSTSYYQLQPSSTPSSQPSSVPSNRPSEDITKSPAERCCPANDGTCPDDEFTFVMRLLDLSPGSEYEPFINGTIDLGGDGLYDGLFGWSGIEYLNFTAIPMFNGGKNIQTRREESIGTAHLAYDCEEEIVCVAAVLNATFMANNPTVTVDEDEDESWIRFGPNEGETKLNSVNAFTFSYIHKPGSDITIGYEGCWNVDEITPQVQNVTNNYVEVHFNRNGQTTSTGKPTQKTNAFVCLEPPGICGYVPKLPTSAPSFSPTKVSSLYLDTPCVTK
jgi:hypothetical protein